MPNELFGLQAEAKPLVGKTCAVPNLKGHGRWWVSIVDQSPGGNFIRVKAGVGFGRARWIHVRDAQEIRDRRGQSPIRNRHSAILLNA